MRVPSPGTRPASGFLRAGSSAPPAGAAELPTRGRDDKNPESIEPEAVVWGPVEPEAVVDDATTAGRGAPSAMVGRPRRGESPPPWPCADEPW